MSGANVMMSVGHDLESVLRCGQLQMSVGHDL